jgi:hypothetical protein
MNFAVLFITFNHSHIPIAQKAMHPNNELLLIWGNITPFNVGTKIVHPT